MVTEEELGEIAEKIRSNKLLFKYGKVKSSKLYFIALVNSSKVLDIGEGQISFEKEEKQICGISKVGDLYVLQKIYVVFNHLKIAYYICEALPFFVMPHLTLDMLKIFYLLIEWQNAPLKERSDRLLYLIDHIGVPEEFKQCKKPLYRGLNLKPLAVTRVIKGKIINLQNRKFSSWTMNSKKVNEFHNSYPGSCVFIYSPLQKEILINVALFLELFNVKNLSYLNEEEVILLNSPKMLTVKHSQLIFPTKFNKDILNVNMDANLKKEY